mmetsp:Transcript_9896/g.20666  ORF Transcript_9896/g.20666 Transcript_9896/m.20666 type:complete len:330 (-) Transcript_9896:129-1118(-)
MLAARQHHASGLLVDGHPKRRVLPQLGAGAEAADAGGPAGEVHAEHRARRLRRGRPDARRELPAVRAQERLHLLPAGGGREGLRHHDRRRPARQRDPRVGAAPGGAAGELAGAVPDLGARHAGAGPGALHRAGGGGLPEHGPRGRHLRGRARPQPRHHRRRLAPGAAAAGHGAAGDRAGPPGAPRAPRPQAPPGALRQRRRDRWAVDRPGRQLVQHRPAAVSAPSRHLALPQHGRVPSPAGAAARWVSRRGVPGRRCAGGPCGISACRWGTLEQRNPDGGPRLPERARVSSHLIACPAVRRVSSWGGSGSPCGVSACCRLSTSTSPCAD